MQRINVRGYTNAVTNTVIDVDGKKCRFCWFDIGNRNATVAYVQVFNRPAASVTLGTTTPLLSIETPATAGRVVALGIMMDFGGDGFSIAATTERANAVALASAVDVNIAL
jgi:hypothetical protein